MALYPGPLSNALIADILLFNRFFVELIGMHSERVSDFSVCERERHVWELNGDCESCSVAGSLRLSVQSLSHACLQLFERLLWLQ